MSKQLCEYCNGNTTMPVLDPLNRTVGVTTCPGCQGVGLKTMTDKEELYLRALEKIRDHERADSDDKRTLEDMRRFAREAILG